MWVIFLILMRIFCSEIYGLNFSHSVNFRSFRSSVQSQVVYAIHFTPLSSHDGINRTPHREFQLLVICPELSTGTSERLVRCTDDSRRAFVVIDRYPPQLVTGLIVHDKEPGMITDIMCKSSRCECRLLNSDANNSTIDILYSAETDKKKEKRAIDISELAASVDEDIERLDISGNRTFFVPVLIFVDSYLIRKFCTKQWPQCCPVSRIAGDYTLCSEIRYYYLNVMAATKHLYEEIDNKDMKIVLSVMDVEAITETKASKSYFDAFVTPGRPSELDINIAAKEANRIAKLHPDYNDVAVALLFVGYDLAGESGPSTIGGAYSEQVCGFSKTAVIEERFGYTSFFTVTHELAHLLGAPHDGKFKDCGSTENQLMGWTFNKARPELSFVFSCCSLASMYNVLITKTCTFKPPTKNQVNLDIQHNKYLGEIVNKDQFCQLTNGDSFTSCSSDSPCKGVLCKKSIDSSVCKLYVGSGLPTLNGEICDSTGSKWCMHGSCVPKNQTGFTNEEQRTCDITKRPREPAGMVPERSNKFTGGRIFSRGVSMFGFLLLFVGLIIFSRENYRRRYREMRLYPFYPPGVQYAGQYAQNTGPGQIRPGQLGPGQPGPGFEGAAVYNQDRYYKT